MIIFLFMAITSPSPLLSLPSSLPPAALFPPSKHSTLHSIPRGVGHSESPPSIWLPNHPRTRGIHNTMTCHSSYRVPSHLRPPSVPYLHTHTQRTNPILFQSQNTAYHVLSLAVIITINIFSYIRVTGGCIPKKIVREIRTTALNTPPLLNITTDASFRPSLYQKIDVRQHPYHLGET